MKVTISHDRHQLPHPAELEIRSGENLHAMEAYSHELTITRPGRDEPEWMKVLLTPDAAATAAEELGGDYTDGFINGQEDAVRTLRGLVASAPGDAAVKTALEWVAGALAEALGG